MNSASGFLPSKHHQYRVPAVASFFLFLIVALAGCAGTVWMTGLQESAARGNNKDVQQRLESGTDPNERGLLYIFTKNHLHHLPVESLEYSDRGGGAVRSVNPSLYEQLLKDLEGNDKKKIIQQNLDGEINAEGIIFLKSKVRQGFVP
jgi:hypothetical protein